MPLDTQVLYLGRWVPREHFRAYVYNDTGKRLANSYEEYLGYMASGIWYSEEGAIPPSGEKIVQMRQGRSKRRQGDSNGSS